MAKSNAVAKRTARNNRSLSSLNRWTGSPMARITCRCQVFPSADVIDHLLPDRVVEQPVDREVASQGVFPGIAETDALRMAAIVVLVVTAKGGHLDLAGTAAPLHRNHPIGGTDGQRPPVAEQRADLPGPGIGGYVVVFGRPVQRAGRGRIHPPRAPRTRRAEASAPPPRRNRVVLPAEVRASWQ